MVLILAIIALSGLASPSILASLPYPDSPLASRLSLLQETFERDARGSLIRRHLPGAQPFAAKTASEASTANTITYHHDASGARKAYIDQANEPTNTVNDFLGRPRLREYVDGTSEIFNYQGPRLSSYTDRQGRTRILGYDSAGRVETVNTQGGETIERFVFGSDGRIARWATPDAVVE